MRERLGDDRNTFVPMWRRRAGEIAIVCFTLTTVIGVSLVAVFRKTPVAENFANCESTRPLGWILPIIATGLCFFAAGAVAAYVNRNATGRPVMRALVLLSGILAFLMLLSGCIDSLDPYSGCPH